MYLKTAALVVVLVPKYKRVPATVEGVRMAETTDDVGTAELRAKKNAYECACRVVTGCR
jgi:hypothetical protein